MDCDLGDQKDAKRDLTASFMNDFQLKVPKVIV